MQTSTEGLMALAAHEGIVLTPYRDSVGVWTLGIGHTAAAGNPDPKTFTGSLTISEAVGLLHHDILKYERGVNNAVTVPLKQHEYDALVSFHYNTGGIARASLTKSLNAGMHAQAAQQFMNWVTPKEITARRMAERDLFLTGKYPKPIATVYPADKSGRVLWGQGQRVDLRDHIVRSTPPAVTDDRPTLRRGDKGDAVKRLQLALASHGRDISADGDFGPKTEAAVRAFQSQRGLAVDAVVGPRTWAVLG